MPQVLLVNDSMVGPFASIDPILARFESADCDVWGLISTTQDAPHFQSHFVGYKGGALATPELVKFWEDVRIEPSKRALILRYEIGLYPVLERAGLRSAAGFPWDLVVSRGQNPTSLGWRRLLMWGFPWVKREIVLRPPPEVPDGSEVRSVVLKKFGQDVMEWV
jgi:lipopolysaccharide biosynthesis protein